MADVEIQTVTNIEGLDELEEAFTNGSQHTVKKFLRKVHNDAAQILVTALSENAPYEEGTLSEDIHKNTTTNTDGVLTRVGPSREAYWGLFQEFGAPEANVPALHWAEEGAKSVQDEVLQKHYEGLSEGLEDMKG
ncbi:MAG TPA: HK97 gp10 family phage protein [Terracidiphilus sp.]|nr:HK97 gp10 family phage protein [Terracidiphilus sp.]